LFDSWSRQKLGHADPAQDPTLDEEVNGFGFERDISLVNTPEATIASYSSIDMR
jgi:hypothetical protein